MTSLGWILVSSGGAGLLAAWDDRLAIVKTGAMTSFMAGSLGGERSAVFHYTDITGIEYNSGLMNGVLEILTPSYSGSANKDFWRGSTKSRNANANDPWTLSNTLPLAKAEYRSAGDQITELRRRISIAKNPGPSTPVSTANIAPAAATSAPIPPPAGLGEGAGLADQLAKLADLHQAGVLSDEEFAAAKQRLLTL
ncbi:SHOCT domain-containing protein [Nocardioides currus]|nr:SHOCT domain-containing protein [Nocardioides currus]